MDIENRIESALKDQRPRLRLQRVMSELLEAGVERDEMVHALDHLRETLRAQGRAEDDELILELIDGFEGWCRTE